MNMANAELRHSIKESSTMGERLRHAREARGFAREEVARALCLKPEIITALESDRCHEIAVPVFVQGYLRNYANLLGLKTKPVEKTGDSIYHPMGGQIMSKNAETAGASFLPGLYILGKCGLRLANYAIIFILAALVFIWWHDRQHQQNENLGPAAVINMSLRETPFARVALADHFGDSITPVPVMIAKPQLAFKREPAPALDLLNTLMLANKKREKHS